MTRAALIRAPGFNDGELFAIESKRNRDDSLYPFWLLRKAFSEVGVDLQSSEDAPATGFLFEVHLNAHKSVSHPFTYGYLTEAPSILSDNGNLNLLRKYRKIFSWNGLLINDDRFIRIGLPNKIYISPFKGWNSRPGFCCIIAGNKITETPDSRELYSERINTIKWFELNAPADFDLYGTGWDLPRARRSLDARLYRKVFGKLLAAILPAPFPSYRGTVASKKETLAGYRFNVCYENLRDIPGYITEKIFDCFFAGCVPVYWGASDIGHYIPSSCFIDRRQFLDTAELYSYLKSISETQYIDYQMAIADYLRSERARYFSAETFVETVVNTICDDLCLV